jgi:peptide/nickel transport system permease protein
MTIACAILMSIVPMAYIITSQSVMAVWLRWFPVFGFDLQGWGTVRFLALPVSVMAIIYLGADVRLYRSIFLEEIAQDYVRTAQAKGVSPRGVLFKHVLKNGAISLITLVVAYLPLLIMGSLLIENFFGIPGLGGLVVNAIQKQDFAIVRAAVFVGSLLYLLGLMLTDICYAVADPRIRLK